MVGWLTAWAGAPSCWLVSTHRLATQFFLQNINIALHSVPTGDRNPLGDENRGVPRDPSGPGPPCHRVAGGQDESKSF